MFIYFNCRKKLGLVNYAAFNRQDRLANFVLTEIKSLISQNKESNKDCPSSKKLEDYIYKANPLTLTSIKEIINKFEEWSAPCYDQAILHDIKEFP